jgi:hypothetical protein
VRITRGIAHTGHEQQVRARGGVPLGTGHRVGQQLIRSARTDDEGVGASVDEQIPARLPSGEEPVHLSLDIEQRATDAVLDVHARGSHREHPETVDATSSGVTP